MAGKFEMLTAIARRYVTNLSRSRARRELLGRSDRLLADIGISRERLEAGVRAWPWRVDGSHGNAAAAGFSAAGVCAEGSVNPGVVSHRATGFTRGNGGELSVA